MTTLQIQNLNQSSAIKQQLLAVTPDTPLAEAIALQIRSRSSCMLVVADNTPESPLVGLFTERDIVRLVTAGTNISDLCLAAVMTTELITIGETGAADIFTAIKLLREHRIRHLPIVGKAGNPIGMITPQTIRELLRPVDLLRYKKVSEVMVQQVIHAPKTASVLEVAKIMTLHRISCVVITERTEFLKPIGIVTERDIVQLCNLGLDLESTPAQAVMSAPLFPIKPEDSMWNANEIMHKHRVRRLVVSNDCGEMVGIVTQTGILDAINPIEIWQTAETLQRAVEHKTSELNQLNHQFQQEVNRRQQVEAALQESQRWLQAIADANPNVIYVYDLTQQRNVYSNREIYATLGYTPAEIKQMGAKVMQNLMHPEDLAKMPEHFQTLGTAKDGDVIENQYRMRHKNGEWRHFRGRDTVFARNTDGSPKQILGSARDISDRKEAEDAQKQSEAKLMKKTAELEEMVLSIKQTQAQLIQSEKMSSLGKLVAGVAHEINNPVSFIYGNIVHVNQYVLELLNLIEIYQKYCPEPAAQLPENFKHIDLDFIKQDLPKTLLSMHAGAERIRKIVLGLRNFSQHDRSELVNADINQCLEDTLLMLSPQLQAKPHRPAIEVSKNYGKLPTIQCFPRELNQVFMNILTNAIDALEMASSSPCLSPAQNPDRLSPARIWISTEISENLNVKIKISNNGPSIPPELQQKIFDPFFTTKPVGQGTGLGLYASYQIVVEKHQGKLQCVSASGHGTSFLIYLPTMQKYPKSG